MSAAAVVRRSALVFSALCVATGACSQPAQKPAPPAASPAPPPPAPQPPAIPAHPQAPSTPLPSPLPPALSGDQINRATFTPAPPPVSPTPPLKDPPPDAALIRAEVLLDRARFSPGVIDGTLGTNFHNALAAYQAHAGLPSTGVLDPATWSALTRDTAPVVTTYTITPADVAGPFAPDVGEDFVKLAALPEGPQFSTPSEALAERFHMNEALLKSLNPGADFGRAGTAITVAAPDVPNFAKGDVKRIEVSKAHAEVTAFGDGDKVLAVYPATVGSTERPSPSGTHKINGVAWNTDYTYDPHKLKWGPRSHGKLHIKPGPNGPVGVVWIALNAPDYGIHGTPDPTKIGKTASHGCVRLTNWDALELAHGVKPGVIVQFVGARRKT